MDKLFLIDGHALIFKMYYAFLRRPMINSKGADMSILFGFTKYLLEMVEREKPTHLAVAFDPPGGTFRNELYPAYKGTRPPTPQLIIDALEPLTELVQAMNIPVLMVKGFEADDVIGSMALRSAREGMDVYMVTPDKDYGQLISEHVFQYKPGKAGGDDEVIGRSAICEKWGILDPVQIIDMLAICGDTADNVPGVKGVGEVGAGKLVSKYGSIENIYAHLGELSPRQQAQFEEARDHIGLSKELVTIKTDIPLETTAEDMRLDMNFSPAIADLFEKYEFNSLKRFIAHIGPSTAAKERKEFIVNEVSVDEIVKDIRAAGHCGLITGGLRRRDLLPRQAARPRLRGQGMHRSGRPDRQRPGHPGRRRHRPIRLRPQTAGEPAGPRGHRTPGEMVRHRPDALPGGSGKEPRRGHPVPELPECGTGRGAGRGQHGLAL